MILAGEFEEGIVFGNLRFVNLKPGIHLKVKLRCVMLNFKN